jgi:radical SAM superfamily enzyme YgiQ (UPF0313 family)
MKILLVAVNAKYIHSNLAVYSLRTFAGKYSDHIKIIEMTINHLEEEILKAIYQERAEVVAFSCYIWNIAMIRRISSQLRKVQPGVKIWYGGPEVTYDAKSSLEGNREPDGIIIGEGEQTFLELVQYYVEGRSSLKAICGLVFKESAVLIADVGNNTTLTAEDQIIETPHRQLLCLDDIPFPYDNIENFKNKIIYYESSRGCPFSCSYCLSSIDKSVRLRGTDLVKQELGLLLDHKVSQVKFVDRTFNCNKQHAMEIWRYIKENDNNVTNFHFEISADLLTEEEIDILATLRPGHVQLEIGVQSTNPDTVYAIHRKMDIDKLGRNVVRIKEAENIHQHLDLIAGLPYEDEQSFERSFNDVYKMRPDQLQLGFLKILKGSVMETESAAYGIIYRDEPPYEVLRTKHLDYDAVLRLKGVCEMVELYYNSAQFANSLGYIEHYYDSSMQVYRDISAYYEKYGHSSMSHSRLRRYEILLDFYTETILPSMEEEESSLFMFKELLVFDLYLRENLKARPDFAPSYPPKNILRELYRKYSTDGKTAHIEQFEYDLSACVWLGKPVKRQNTVLFDYQNRNPLSKAASIKFIEAE